MGNVFQAGADKTLADVQKIYQGRGEEYLDSWHIDNINPVFTRKALETLGRPGACLEAIRLLWAATMCDIKLSRMTGPWKADTAQDAIAYIAFFTDLIEKFKAGKSVDTQ